MILMYHHVCPKEVIPLDPIPIEGWKYTIHPTDFENQLSVLKTRGFQFVSMSEYVSAMREGHQAFLRMVSVTFDDGWRDNFDYALPVLQRLDVPATIFVVSGEMQAVPSERRMTHEHLRYLVASGITIGAHTRTHPNLTKMTADQLDSEIGGCKTDLEAILGTSVDYLAYPGGRFNQEVVKACQSVGFHAACSVINWGRNSEASRYWLYREVFSDRMDRLSDVVRLNPLIRKLLHRRAENRVSRMLSVGETVRYTERGRN